MGKSDRVTLEAVLESVRKENPSYWPNGLHKGLYDGENDNLTPLEDSSGEVYGFLGWQERGGKGYYSIGLLPEFRKKGIAKALLPQYIKEMNKNNLPVRGSINKENKPSIALADSLGITVNLT